MTTNLNGNPSHWTDIERKPSIVSACLTVSQSRYILTVSQSRYIFDKTKDSTMAYLVRGVIRGH